MGSCHWFADQNGTFAIASAAGARRLGVARQSASADAERTAHTLDLAKRRGPIRCERCSRQQAFIIEDLLKLPGKRRMTDLLTEQTNKSRAR